MIGTIGARDAWGRTRAMARRAGLDLPGAIFDGWLSRREAALLVDACAACGVSPLCQTALDAPAMPDLPAYCRNKDDLEALA